MVEIGSVALASGSVTPVKALGVLAMIDDGELDWKVVAIAASDPMASELNDVADIEAKMPGTLSGIREWFRWYKVRHNRDWATLCVYVCVFISISISFKARSALACMDAQFVLLFIPYIRLMCLHSRQCVFLASCALRLDPG